MNLKIGDNVIVNWETENVYRFLYGKIIDILTENEKTKYKVEYIDNLARWESGLKIELWEKKHIRKRFLQSEACPE
jgi:hypothetical protein